MTHARSGKILIQVAVIIVVGTVLGVADAYIRHIDLTPRKAPPPLPPVTAPEPESPTGGAATTTESSTPNTAPTPEPAVTSDPTPTAATPNASFTPTPKEKLPVGHITIEEAFSLYQRGLTDFNTFFVDSRKLEDYTKGHVPGAIRIDTSMFQIKEPDELGLIPRTGYVVVYCNGGHCDESENVAKRLDGSGYQFVYVLHDGLPGWQSMGHPVQTGE